MDNLNENAKEHYGLLTESIMRDLFGANYNNIFYYNFDTKTFSNTHKGQPCYMNAIVDVDSKGLPYLPMAVNWFLGEYGLEMVAAVAMITGQHSKKYGEFVKNPRFDKNGKNVVCTIVTRNIVSSKINPVDTNWVSFGENGQYENTQMALRRGFNDFVSGYVERAFSLRFDLANALARSQLANSR